MFWPDTWLLGLLFQAFMDLGSENKRATGFITLFFMLAVPIKLFQLTLYQVWQRKIFLQPFMDDGGSMNELGRVAWPVGIREGLLQRIWFRHGWLCRKYPSVWQRGYSVSLYLALGAFMLFTMDYWSYLIVLAMEPAATTWIVEVKREMGWFPAHRPWLLTLMVGLAARGCLLLSAIWFAKTFVVRGILGNYWFWPGTPPSSLDDINWWDANALPFGFPELNNLDIPVSAGNTVPPVVLYIRPRGAWWSFLFSPQPWVFQEAPGSTKPAYIYLGESHGKMRQHPTSGRHFMVPSHHFLESQDDWLSEARTMNIQELDIGKELVERGAETSADQKVKLIYDRTIMGDQHPMEIDHE
jgi:hypothetical protein|tara:strand:+ start:1801 stop:2865 length:1065 start_codon:yes stop_codon:yes gene_type:complete